MFDRTFQLSFSTEIEVDVQSLYDFHIDTNNLLKITPPWIRIEIVSLGLPLHKGSQIELEITRFGIPQRWKMQIEELKPPALVCDKALKSPFASFVHHHRFAAINDNRSRLCDELEISLPYYPLSWIALPFIKRDIRKMFDYRHKQTKKLLEKTMFNTSLYLDEKCHSQPRIAALLTCGNNIMPLAWHMPVSKEPLRYAVAVRSENHTHTLIKQNKEFALNFLDISYQHAYQLCGEVHGENIDKFELCGLHQKNALSIQSTLIEEAYMIYECTLIDIINYGDHDIFIADVNIILNTEIKEVEPTLFMGKGYYDTVKGEPIRLKRIDDV